MRDRGAGNGNKIEPVQGLHTTMRWGGRGVWGEGIWGLLQATTPFREFTSESPGVDTGLGS